MSGSLLLLLSLCQAHESLISGHFPASEENLQNLAALRLQYLQSDGAGRAGWSLGNVYPIARLRHRIMHSTKQGTGAGAGVTGAGGAGVGDGKGVAGIQGAGGVAPEKRRTPSFLDGTLRRSFKTGSLKKQKVWCRGWSVLLCLSVSQGTRLRGQSC